MRLAARSTVRLQSWSLKLGGKPTRAGVAFTVFAALWLAFTAHSGFVQAHRALGRFQLDRTEASRADVLSGQSARATYSLAHAKAVERAGSHFEAAHRWGLARVLEVELGRLWIGLLRNDAAGAEDAFRAAIALAPARADLYDDYFHAMVARGRLDEALGAKHARIDALGDRASDRCELGGVLARAERYAPAATEYEACLALGGDAPAVRYELGGLYRRLDRPAQAVEHLRVAAAAVPDDPDTRVELGLALAALDRPAEAAAELRRAFELAPERPESQLHLPGVIAELEREAIR
jgi:tetratricopeptide (TPR) repeat protein